MKQFVQPLYSNQTQDASHHIGKTVVLFGAGCFVQLAIHALGQRGIIPVCLCDNSRADWGPGTQSVPTLIPTEARTAFPDATVIITTAPGQLEEAYSHVMNVGWTDIHDCAHLLSSFPYDSDSFPFSESWLHFLLDRYFYEYFLKYQPDRLILPSIDIVITEKCSLKCRDCANLMQYYTHPRDIDFDTLFASMDVLMRSIDYVFELRVLGGEPFMNKRVHQYIERLRQYSNYRRIAVYTNATIVPSQHQLRCLSHDDTYIRISYYGCLSRKLALMTEALDTCGVTYQIDVIPGWQECAAIGKRDRTQEDLEAVFSNCCANNILTILNTRIYQCPFAANAYNIGALPPDVFDSIETVGSLSREEMRCRLFEMLREKKHITACTYCAGRPNGVAPLPVALQTTLPLHYKRLSVLDIQGNSVISDMTEDNVLLASKDRND